MQQFADHLYFLTRYRQDMAAMSHKRNSKAFDW